MDLHKFDKKFVIYKKAKKEKTMRGLSFGHQFIPVSGGPVILNDISAVHADYSTSTDSAGAARFVRSAQAFGRQQSGVANIEIREFLQYLEQGQITCYKEGSDWRVRMGPRPEFNYMLPLVLSTLEEKFLIKKENSIMHPLKPYFDAAVRFKRIGFNTDGSLKMLQEPKGSSEEFTDHVEELPDTVLQQLCPVFQDLFIFNRKQQQSAPSTPRSFVRACTIQ